MAPLLADTASIPVNLLIGAITGLCGAVTAIASAAWALYSKANKHLREDLLACRQENKELREQIVHLLNEETERAELREQLARVISENERLKGRLEVENG